MLKYIAFFIVCLPTIFQSTKAYYFDSQYKELMDCDEFEPCWSFVDDKMVKVINRQKDSDNNPCTSFFDYATNNNYLSEDENNLFDLIEHVFDNKVEDFLKNSNHNENDKKDIRNLISRLKLNYEQCKENAHIDAPPLLDDLPTMPTLKWPDWKKELNNTEWQTHFSWVNYVAEFRRFGLNRLFIEEHVTIAYNDSTRYVVELKVPEEIRYDTLQPSFEYILSIFNLTDTQIYKQTQFVNRIRELEQLAHNLRSNHQTKNAQKELKQLLTLGELKKIVISIDWQNYFNALLKSTQVPENLPIQISNLNYFKDIGTLIDQTDDKTLAFYLLLRFIYYGLGVMPRTSTSSSCSEKLSLYYPIGVNYIYDRFIYKTRNKDEAELEKIFTALKKRLSENIKDNKLNLSVQQQYFLQQKLNGMTIQILPQNKPVSYYNNYYDGVNTMHLSFWSNQWEIMRFKVDQQHAKLLKNSGYMEPKTNYEPEDPYKQRSEPYFMKSQNRIVVPLEFIRPPFFTHGENPVFRYSITAFSLARELMKAFDPFGVTFDANGNQNEIGIGISEHPKFHEVWTCVNSDTEKYFLERFADVSGFQLVVDTFFNDLPKTGENSSITIETMRNSKVTYEVRKLFFLQLAQYFGGHLNYLYRYESYSKKQQFNDRLDMIVSNVPEFAEVFNCKFESKEKKCKIW